MIKEPKGKITAKMIGSGGGRRYILAENFGFTHISKNNSTIMKNLLFLVGGKSVLQSYTNRPEILTCIWRDPKTRLISGLGEYVKRSKIENPRDNLDKWQRLFEKLYKSPLDFDEHLEPQISYTEGFYYDHVFRFENLLSDLRQCDFIVEKIPNYLNKINEGRTQRSKHTGLTFDEIISNHSDLIDAIIDKYYSLDLEIYNNIEILKNPKKIIKL